MGGGNVSDREGKKNDESDLLVLASAGTTICITRGSSNRCCENARDKPEPVGAGRSSAYTESGDEDEEMIAPGLRDVPDSSGANNSGFHPMTRLGLEVDASLSPSLSSSLSKSSEGS